MGTLEDLLFDAALALGTLAVATSALLLEAGRFVRRRKARG